MPNKSDEIAMITIKELIKMPGACPTQWEGITDDNRFVYIRYRHGTLTVTLGDVNGNIHDTVNHGELIFKWKSNDEWSGVMSDEELKTILLDECDIL